MNKLLISFLGASALFAGALVYAHCEVPCGIYADDMRIRMLREDAATIEKAMKQIKVLTGKQDALSLNQTVRWITTKDEHATKLQHVVTQYFMTQRIKLPKAGDAAAEKKYLFELRSLHEMLVYAMKTKQTLDPSWVKKLNDTIDGFAKSYLSKADLEHLKGHHK